MYGEYDEYGDAIVFPYAVDPNVVDDPGSAVEVAAESAAGRVGTEGGADEEAPDGAVVVVDG